MKLAASRPVKYSLRECEITTHIASLVLVMKYSACAEYVKEMIIIRRAAAPIQYLCALHTHKVFHPSAKRTISFSFHS